MNPHGKRARLVIDPDDQKRLLRALQLWADGGEFVALRTRAFVLLLWDGAVRTSEALALNIEEVVKDSRSRRPAVVLVIEQRPRVENDYRGRSIVLSPRTQDAIRDYLEAARDGGWLPNGQFKGPLFISTRHPGEAQRLSPRSASHWWERFQKEHAHDCSDKYQLEDVVMTGRVAYVRAAGGKTDSLSDHSGISRRWAAEYHSEPGSPSPAEVMAKLHRRR